MRDVKNEVSLHRRMGAHTSSLYLAGQLAGSLTSPSQAALREETIAELRDALDEMDDIDREVLVLRHFEELSNNEVAQVLGLDKFAASKRYLRALKRLRTAMSQE